MKKQDNKRTMTIGVRVSQKEYEALSEIAKSKCWTASTLGRIVLGKLLNKEVSV